MICLSYYAKTDETGFPIPGTMMGYKGLPGTCGTTSCERVLLPSVTYALGSGDVQIFHPTKRRFFVKLDAYGKIIPNSLTSSLIKPRGARTAEFIKYYNISVGM